MIGGHDLHEDVLVQRDNLQVARVVDVVLETVSQHVGQPLADGYRQVPVMLLLQIVFQRKQVAVLQVSYHCLVVGAEGD